MLGLGLGLAGGACGWVAVRAGLWGVLPRFGFRGTSPQARRHPTSICDSGVNTIGKGDNPNKIKTKDSLVIRSFCRDSF